VAVANRSVGHSDPRYLFASFYLFASLRDIPCAASHHRVSNQVIPTD